MAPNIFSPDVLLANHHFIQGGRAVDKLKQLGVRDPEQLLRDLNGGGEFGPVAKATNSGAKILPVSAFQAPTLNPYLQTEALGLARVAYTDCVELRKRIESLQIDIFNLDQVVSEFEGKTICRDNEIARLQESLNRTIATLSLRSSDIERVTLEKNRAEVHHENFGSKSSLHAVAKRTKNKVISQYWPLVFGSTAGGPPTVSAYTNVDAERRAAAGLSADLPFESAYSAIQAEASFAAESEADAIEQSLQAATNTLSSLNIENEGLLGTKRALELQIESTKQAQSVDAEIIRRKRLQFTENGAFDLRRRLQDSLVLYDELLGTLRQALFAAEYGQALLFKRRIEGFDPASETRKNRYIFADPTGIQEGDDLPSLDATWISLDMLGVYLTRAEARHRQMIQQQRYHCHTLSIDGELIDDKFEKVINLGSEDDRALASGVSRIVAFSLVNLGDPVDVRIKFSRSVVGLNGVDAAFLSALDANIEISGAFGAPIYQQPIQAFDLSCYVNRSFTGALSVRVQGAEPESAKVRLRLNFVVADER